jgi:hypothetical protein
LAGFASEIAFPALSRKVPIVAPKEVTVSIAGAVSARIKVRAFDCIALEPAPTATVIDAIPGWASTGS